MALAIFDLDNTLLSDDSDYLWGEYMVAHGIVDRDLYQRENKSFLGAYQRGELDNDLYLAFALKPLTMHPVETLHNWRRDFVANWITPIIAPGSQALLDRHREKGDMLMIISATNRFITAPIAELLGIEQLLSTEPEIVDSRYTGRYLGTPTYKEGKVAVLNQWLESSGKSLEGSYFYSDSINDLPLLEQVTTPVAVNPDDALATIARQRHWEIMDLRQ